MGNNQDPSERFRRKVLKALPWMKDEKSRDEHRKRMMRKEREIADGPESVPPMVHWAGASIQERGHVCGRWGSLVLQHGSNLDRETAGSLSGLSEQIAFWAAQIGIDAAPLRAFDSALGSFISGFSDDARSVADHILEASLVVDEVEARCLAAVISGSPGGDSHRHAPDFSWVQVYDQTYRFKIGNQARTVAAMWSVSKAGKFEDGCGISAEGIQDAIGSSALKLRVDDLFRKHEAWGSFIRRTPEGTFALYFSNNLGE